MKSNIIYDVYFPKMGLNFKITPIAFQFGNFTIYWYGIIVACGFLLGLVYINCRAREFNLTQNKISDISLIASIFAIICARLYYVLFYPGDFYKKNPLKIFMISEGGIAIYGAIIGGFLGILVISRINSFRLSNILDLVSLGLLIGQTIGRWGNFFNQEAFGSETELWWGMSSNNTDFKVVHPCFLYESIGCCIIFIFLHFYSKRIKFKAGNIFLFYMMFYGILRTLIENFRTDSLMLPGSNLKISQILSIVFFLIAFLVYCFSKFAILKKNR